MRNRTFCSRLALCLVAAAIGLSAALAPHAANAKKTPAPAANSKKAAASAKTRDNISTADKKAIADYRAKYDAYRLARQPYEKKAAAYWPRVIDARKARRAKRARGVAITLADYVLDQPPVYSGPPAPVPPPIMTRTHRVTPKRTLPIVADFLRHARDQFKFVPERPASEAIYKRSYAIIALPAGLTTEQAVRIYGFEAGGNGKYDVQAGLEHPGPKAEAISTALGYNQLLIANTISLLADHGQKFIEALERMLEKAEGDRRKRLEGKLAALKRMVAFAHSIPKQWSVQERFGRTPKGMALHALNLDVDIGPMLQTEKLMDSVAFAKKNGFRGKLTAAELEMMNLMGDGSGLDILLLTPEMRDKVPTSNFFLRQGYERNPVAIRNNVASTLIAATDRRMDSQAGLAGAKEMEAAFDAVAADLRRNAARR